MVDCWGDGKADRTDYNLVEMTVLRMVEMMGK